MDLPPPERWGEDRRGDSDGRTRRRGRESGEEGLTEGKEETGREEVAQFAAHKV